MRNVKEAAVKAIRGWVASLPDNTAYLDECETRFEHVMRIIPENHRAAEIEFRISRHETFGLYVGWGIRIEQLPLSASYLVEICEAVRNGEMMEELWQRNGKPIKVTAVLRLQSGDLHGTEYRGAFGTVGANEYMKKQYEPYRDPPVGDRR